LSSGMCSVVVVGMSAFEIPSEVMAADEQNGEQNAKLG
jgi:hypothetical protein